MLTTEIQGVLRKMKDYKGKNYIDFAFLGGSFNLPYVGEIEPSEHIGEEMIFCIGLTSAQIVLYGRPTTVFIPSEVVNVKYIVK